MEEIDQALKIALRALKRRDLFEAEIRVLLAKHNLDHHAGAVMKALSEKLNWNDARVAAAYLERSKTKGAERVTAELAARGALVEVSFDDEAVRARGVLLAKFGETLDPVKAFRFLRGRGFSLETCEEVIPTND